VHIEGHGEAEMEARAVAHHRVAARHVGVHRVGRLHVGEGRDDDAPDALDSVERQDALMALDETAHHLGLAGRPERRAAAGLRLHRDQPVDDLAALDQARVKVAVDPIDLLAQRLELGLWFQGSGVHVGVFIVAGAQQGKAPAPRRAIRRVATAGA
jgi:hypothetical protein